MAAALVRCPPNRLASPANLSSIVASLIMGTCHPQNHALLIVPCRGLPIHHWPPVLPYSVALSQSPIARRTCRRHSSFRWRKCPSLSPTPPTLRSDYSKCSAAALASLRLCPTIPRRAPQPSTA